jgi:hypothetical protein
MFSIVMLNARELAITAAIVAVLCSQFIDGQIPSALVECANAPW